MNLLFYKEGFSFFVSETGKSEKVHHFKVSHFNFWEKEVNKELETNLRLRKHFSQVNAAFISPFFNLVPNEYLGIDAEALLNFSEAEFENNKLLKSPARFGQTFVYGVSQSVLDRLNSLFSKVKTFHSGSVFVDFIATSGEKRVHINLYEHNLEIAVSENEKIIYYNLFETLTGEDILFYSLFVFRQLELDTNKTELLCYGQLLPNTKVFQIFKKYVRYVKAAIKDEDYLENFTLYNLSKCESFQVLSEEKR